MAQQVMGPPPGLLPVSQSQITGSTASIEANDQFIIPPGALPYNYTAKNNNVTYLSSTSVEDEDAPGDLQPNDIDSRREDSEAFQPQQETCQALKIQLHVKHPFHLGLKSLASAERDNLERSLVQQLCIELDCDPSLLEMIDVSHPAPAPMYGTNLQGNLLLQSAEKIGSVDDDINSIKSFACMFSINTEGHIKVREVVARLKENQSLSSALRRPRFPGPDNNYHSLNFRFGSMFIVPGTVSTFEEMITFFGANAERYKDYTTLHKVAAKTIFLKDFETAYVRRAFSSMDATCCSFLEKNYLCEAARPLSTSLWDRVGAFEDNYLTETELIEILDDVHGEFMSAWSFKKLLEQLQGSYLQMMSKKSSI